MLPHADAAFFSDADTPMTPDVDDPMIPGNNAAPGSQWYRRVRLGILITQFPPARFQINGYVCRCVGEIIIHGLGICSRCPLGVRAVECLFDGEIVCVTGDILMRCIRCDLSRRGRFDPERSSRCVSRRNGRRSSC